MPTLQMLSARVLIATLVQMLKDADAWPNHDDCLDRDASTCLRCGLDASIEDANYDLKEQS